MTEEIKRPEKKEEYTSDPERGDGYSHTKNGIRWWNLDFEQGYNESCDDWEPYYRQKQDKLLEIIRSQEKGLMELKQKFDELFDENIFLRKDKRDLMAHLDTLRMRNYEN